MFVQLSHKQKMQRMEARNIAMVRLQRAIPELRVTAQDLYMILNTGPLTGPKTRKLYAQYHNTLKHAGFNRHGNVISKHR